MKKKLFLLFCAALCFLQATQARQGDLAFGPAKVSGHVKNQSNQPIPGASVVVLQAGAGTLTNNQGFYSFSLTVLGSFTIEYAYPGCGSKLVPVTLTEDLDTTINVTLTCSAIDLSLPVLKDQVALHDFTVKHGVEHFLTNLFDDRIYCQR